MASAEQLTPIVAKADGSCCNESGFCGFGPDYCASNICVGKCDAKSECNPGFGSQWAKADDCPLNACCSEVGYCGITQEFCGDRKFSKPTCSKDYPVNRVIGYYEGGAAHRSCDRFTPGDIQADVYTHVNFAYAAIDPDTFWIMQAFKKDAETYHQLSQLRRYNPGLKVFISVGGWAFNNGPNNDTFSKMVASEANQRNFITSLISFINTYNFDGVDINWRYPGASARGGSAGNVDNLVGFARNLRMALRTNGQRNGFSITVPAAYLYLQYYNLQGLSKYISWFNVLSFDLHRAFNSPDTWTDNRLNAHTNLTEISNAMDLI
ncbi:glycoside hydrolase superfamily [Dactylonectria estremocensis]|uniref:chitinase n=1 Tax=Dactylonectria estremocensis TaxID=1079267 RepID=A0A9P9EUB1_9HYPO|nr:glycoside hydrolase superfamily [Dactylonectria estremocensis]